MPYLSYFIFVALSLFGMSPAYADLFRDVTVDGLGYVDGQYYSNFDRWLFVYKNNTNHEFLIHLQVDNANCDVKGQGVIVQVVNNQRKIVSKEQVPGNTARAMSLIVPSKSRIQVKFLGHPNKLSDTNKFDYCNSSVPKGYYTISEPYLN